MKLLARRHGNLNCDFVAEGETVREVIEKATNHIQMDHPEKMKEMMDGMTYDEVKAAMSRMTKDV